MSVELSLIHGQQDQKDQHQQQQKQLDVCDTHHVATSTTTSKV